MSTRTAKKRAPRKPAKKVIRKKRAVTTKAAKGNGQAGETSEMIIIQAPQVLQSRLRIVGNRPLLVSNKDWVAPGLDKIYGAGAKDKGVNIDVKSPDMKFQMAFYGIKYPNPFIAPPPPMEPWDEDEYGKGLFIENYYGIPVTGFQKAVGAAVRLAGITNNAQVGVIQRSFQVLSPIHHRHTPLVYEYFVRDVRSATPPSSTCPQMRHRPRFEHWSCELLVEYNPRILSISSVVNLFMYAGRYIGWGEMRAEKKQGECGGFDVEVIEN